MVHSARIEADLRFSDLAFAAHRNRYGDIEDELSSSTFGWLETMRAHARRFVAAGRQRHHSTQKASTLPLALICELDIC